MKIQVTYEGWKPKPYTLEYLQPGHYAQGGLTPDVWIEINTYHSEGEAMTAAKAFVRGKQVVYTDDTQK